MIASNHYDVKGSVQGRDDIIQFTENKKIKNIKKDVRLTKNKNKRKKKNDNKKDDDDDNDEDNYKLDENGNGNDSDSDKINKNDDECGSKFVERRDQIFSSLHSVAKLSKAKLGA